jgi:hypothetical protein
MEYDETASASASLDRAWAALSAVTAYPQWTASMTTVSPLDGDDLVVGRRFRIKQPGMPPLVWKVSEVREGESFTWEARSPGVRTVGYHRLSRAADETTQITLGLRQTGILSGPVRMLMGSRTRRFLKLEAAGLKAAAEAAAAK